MILFKVLTKKCVKDSASQFQNFPMIFHEFHALLYGIITVRLAYHKFCVRWVLKMLMVAHKTQRMASAWPPLERYHKDGDAFLNHIARVTDDETWVIFVNVESTEQLKQWRHPHSPTKPKKFKETLSARKLMAAVFWDSKRVLMVVVMQQWTTITSEVYCETQAADFFDTSIQKLDDYHLLGDDTVWLL
jgi:hypothetical protein